MSFTGRAGRDAKAAACDDGKAVWVHGFPKDFMSISNNMRGMHIKKMPFAFTEQGIYMLATVLRGELAIQQSIFIMRAFKEMRHYIKQNQQFVTHSEMNLVTARVSEIVVQVAGVVDQQKKTERDIAGIQKSIDSLNESFITEKDSKNYVIYKGQKFESRAAFNRMIDDIKSGKDGVAFALVFKLSRFGRNVSEVLSTLQLMQDYSDNYADVCYNTNSIILQSILK